MKTLILLLIVSFTLNSQTISERSNLHSDQIKQFAFQSSYSDYQVHFRSPGKFRKPSITNGSFYIPQEIIIYRTGSTQKYNITYDAQGNWTNELWMLLSNSIWVNDYRNTATYDANGSLVSVFGESWEQSAWVNSYRGTYVNDAHGYVLTELVEFWLNNAWVPSSRYTNTYDASGNVLTWTAENYNAGVWTNASQYIFTYDAAGRLIEEVGRNWTGTAWVDADKGIYSYNSNGKILQETFQQFVNSQWVNTWQNIYSYDAGGNMINELVQRWVSNAWTDYGRYTCTYDANGGLLRDIYEKWENSTWGNLSKREYVNDINGYAVQGDFYEWQNTAWVEGEGMLRIRYLFNSQYMYSNFYARKIAVQYLVISGINENSERPEIYHLSQNYPNPFNPSTVIRYSLAAEGNVSLKLFDVLGNELATLINEEQKGGTYEYKLSASEYNLCSGVYFYQLRAGAFVSTKKMILMK